MKQLKHKNLAGTMVSTVKLSSLFSTGAFPYETCIFGANGESEVQQSYRTEKGAIKGHKKYCEKVGATIKV